MGVKVMNIGAKIKRLRTFRGKTQRGFGEEVGFSKSAADVRVNQYESGRMAPKADVRQKMAEILSVDVEALSDIDLSSPIETVHALYQLEDECGMKLEYKDGKTSLVFDNDYSKSRTLVSLLNMWCDKKAKSDENYEDWKLNIGSNVEKYYYQKREELSSLYAPLLSEIGKDELLKTVSDLTETIRRMIEADISVLPTATKEAVGFTFKISELLNSENRDFALFLNEFNYIKNRGIVCEDEYLYLNGMVTITYWIGIPSLSVVCTDINNLNEYLRSEDKSDFAKDEFESSFKSSLMTQNNSLEDEIKFYS